MVEVAIVIVSYNTSEALQDCINTLVQYPPDTSHEIIVIDNNSSDGSAPAIRARWPHIKVVNSGSNLGFAKATNLGIRKTMSRMILLLNSDTLPAPGAVDGLVQVLKSRSAAAAVGPRLVGIDGSLEVSFGRMISPLNECLQKFLILGYKHRVPFFKALVEYRAQNERIVDWVSGACLLVNRHDAEKVNLLDERFFLYTEDVDFCASLRSRGRQILFTPTVEIVHHSGLSGQHSPIPTAEFYRRSHLAFYRKHHPMFYSLLRGYLSLRGKLPV